MQACMDKFSSINSVKKKLYWVSTSDHGEDWFIIANNTKTACKFHEECEGYNYGYAKAKEIMDVGKNYDKQRVYHAQLWMLVDLGFIILSEKPFRVVFKSGKTYRERTTLDSVIENESIGKEGLYIMRISGTDQYKIGITKDLLKRLSNIQTGNPLPIEVYAFYPTKHYKKLEQFLHKFLKERLLGGEWFYLPRDDLSIVHAVALSESKIYFGYTGTLPHYYLGEY